MRFSTGVVEALATPMLAWAFIQPTTRNSFTFVQHQHNEYYSKSINNFYSISTSDKLRTTTDLEMAFKLKEGETSNMFDGPLALTRERDACGVGFIVNTKGGK